MQRIRDFLRNHIWLAFALMAAAMLARVLVPAGYMPSGITTLSFALCSGIEEGARVDIVIPASKDHQSAGKAPCDFTLLGHDLMAAADPLLLAASILFILALGFRPQSFLDLARTLYLLPPLRGPPAA